jgi:formylglycine-generating enzyme required for sulfatase activity/dienelactone hydrolase
MGEVYLAHDAELERDVAVKVLSYEPGDIADRERERRFIQEAKAASALNHPNVISVFEIGSHDGIRFIAMELVRGETLRKRLGRGALPVAEAINVGAQITAGVAAAHSAGIVHRDIKPENVIIRPDGYVKVLDFGLAKLRVSTAHDAATVLKTAPGMTMGTLGYMAPEQLTGSDVTPAADVFSIGVVLYEMLAGRSPFRGATATELVGEILSKAPQPLTNIPPKLETVLFKALAKNPADRYAAAGELLEELKSFSGGLQPAEMPRTAKPRAMRWLVAALVLLVIGAGIFAVVRSRRIANARVAVAEAEQLVRQGRFDEAFRKATAAVAFLPGDDRVRDVIVASSEKLTIESDPPGATAYLQAWQGPPERLRAGVTPLTTARLPRAHYILTLEKPGYAPGIRPLTTVPMAVRELTQRPEPTKFRVKLIEASRVPPGMSYVPGGEIRLAGWYRASDRVVQLGDFLVDKYEVSNAEFEEFIRAGGYRHRELWKHRFVADGKTLSFDQAIARMRDTTGLPAPRSWAGGAAPAGKATHPVSDVTWYEAAAFAEWKGKQLPTVYQFDRASRYPFTRAVGSNFPWGIVAEGVDATERANFGGKGTVAADAMPFGVSAVGAYHMAGNVSEWGRNALPPGFVARGGGWNDAVYAYGRTFALPPFYAASTLGFRCVKSLQDGTSDDGGFDLSPSGFLPQYKAVGDAEYESLRARYDYVKTPINGRVVETVDAAAWRRETVEFTAGDKTVPAYLYIPKGYSPPLQVIYLSPAGDVVSGWRSLPQSVESQLAPAIRSGRAVFSVMLEGFIGRPRTVERPSSLATAEYVDYVFSRVYELRRGMDYIESRKDLDASRIAFVGPSAGAAAGVILTAVDPRFRSVMFIGTGLEPEELGAPPIVGRMNFAPRIKAPKLMLQGRYDEDAPLASSAEPLFRLMRDPKRLTVYEGSHVPSAEIAVPAIQNWLDETLGPVAQ